MMNRPFFVIIGIGLLIGFLVIGVSVKMLLQIKPPDKTQQLLETLTEAQRQAYRQQQYKILDARQAGELRALQHGFFWALVWRFITLFTVIAFAVAGVMFIVRRSRHKFVVTTTTAEGQALTTEIPIINETKEERLMVSSSQVARNLALAQGDMNEQTRQMLQVIGQVSKQLNVGSRSQALSLNPMGAEVLPSQDALPAAEVTASEVLKHPRTDNRFLVGCDEMRSQIYCSLKNDVFHLNIAGQTGSGKTTSLKFYIAQWIQNHIVNRVFLCDNHLGNPEGLTRQMGQLTDLPMVHTCHEMTAKDMVVKYAREMIERIDNQKPWDEIWVMILDEGLALFRGIRELKEMLERGTTESRKYGMFLVLVAQTQKYTQIPTEVRDNFSSMLVHRMKPKQANLLLQDKDRSKVTGRLQQGQAYFVDAVGKFEGVLTVPLVSPEDIRHVVDRMSSGTIDIDPLPFPTDQVQLFTPQEIQTKVRAAIGPRLRLGDIYRQAFVDGFDKPIMAEGTFKKRIKNYEERPWQPDELRIMSQWLTSFYGAAQL